MLQPQRATAAALQIRKARHKGHLHAGRLKFGEEQRAGNSERKLRTRHPAPSMCSSHSLCGDSVFYQRKAVWAFKAASLSETSKQLYKAEDLMKDTTADLSLGNRIAARR